MSDIDVTKGIEGLSDEQKAELMSKLQSVMNETKSRYIANVQKTALLERYKQEVDGLQLDGLSSHARVRKLSGVKSKYRAMGLEVW